MVSDLLLYCVLRTLCTIEHVHFLHVSLVLPRLYCTEQWQSSLTRHPSLVLRLPFPFRECESGNEFQTSKGGVGAAGLGAAICRAHPCRAAAQKYYWTSNFLRRSSKPTIHVIQRVQIGWSGICASLIARARNAWKSCLWALPHFMRCWKDGWCRLKEFRKYLLCKFVAMHLPHSTVKRHHIEYGSNNAWVIILL